MSRAKKPPHDDLLAALKKAILAALNDPNTSPAERMKAIETGAKLLAIESKIDNANKGSSFFE